MNQVAIKTITSEANRRRLKILWQDGVEASFAYIQLRHYCNYPVLGRPEQPDDAPCLIPEAPQTPTIKTIDHSNDQISIQWSHDNSQTEHSAMHLREVYLSNKNNESALRKQKQTTKLKKHTSIDHLPCKEISIMILCLILQPLFSIHIFGLNKIAILPQINSWLEA